MTEREELIARVEAEIAACNGPTTKWTHMPVCTADLRALIALASPVVDEAAVERMARALDPGAFHAAAPERQDYARNIARGFLLAAFPQAESNSSAGNPGQSQGAPGITYDPEREQGRAGTPAPLPDWVTPATIKAGQRVAGFMGAKFQLPPSSVATPAPSPEVSELIEAARPFADWWSEYLVTIKELQDGTPYAFRITAGAYRRLAAALKPWEPK